MGNVPTCLAVNFHRNLQREKAMRISIITIFILWVTLANAFDVVDQKNRTIQFDNPVKRVVSIPIPAPSMFMAIDGSADKLVGVHQLTKTAMKGRFLGRLFPEVLQLPSDFVGGGFNFMPNVERVLSLKPDLVFQWGNYGDEIFDPLTNAGLNVAAIKIRNEQDTREWIRIMSTVLGKEDKALKMVNWREATMRTVKANSFKIEKKKNILYFRLFRNNLQVAGKGTYNDFYINLVGGVNPAAGNKGFYNVTPEQVVVWNPDIVLMNGFEPKLSPKNYIEHPVFSVTDAAINKTVYSMPLGGYRWDPPNQESPLTWMWLGMLTDSDQHKYSLRDEIKRSYKMLYETNPSDQDLNEILKMKMNAGSKGYSDLFK